MEFSDLYIIGYVQDMNHVDKYPTVENIRDYIREDKGIIKPDMDLLHSHLIRLQTKGIQVGDDRLFIVMDFKRGGYRVA